MVKITDYKLRESQEGKPFFALTLQSGVEIVKSISGKMYATVRRVSMPTTFDEVTCQSLIGTEITGNIVKVECDPYDYTVPESREVVRLQHRFEYMEEEVQNTQTDFTKFYKHSTNGVKQSS